MLGSLDDLEPAFAPAASNIFGGLRPAEPPYGVTRGDPFHPRSVPPGSLASAAKSTVTNVVPAGTADAASARGEFENLL